MFDIPEKYSANQVIEPKNFIQPTMKKAEKDRIKENILEARLVWQIVGEDVPSFVDSRYNCSVIMGLDVRLKSLKTAAHFAELIQHMIKAPCVVRLHDHNTEVYSFAHKRLSQTDSSQVVIEHRVETPPLPIALPDKMKGKLKQCLAYDVLLNKTDKFGLYMEATVKAFIVSHPKLYSGIEDLLDRKLWYNRDEALRLLEQLTELMRLNSELKAEKLPTNKVKLTNDFKRLMREVKDFEK